MSTGDLNDEGAHGRWVPVSAAVSALALSSAAVVVYVGFGVLLADLEMGISGRTSGFAVLIPAVLSLPAIVMFAGAILMLRRSPIGRIMITVTTAAAVVVVVICSAVGSALDEDREMALRAAAFTTIPLGVLLLATSAAAKAWTGPFPMRSGRPK